MRISVQGFRGMIPRIASHLLPTSCAQTAYNCRLLNGNLVPMAQTATIQIFPGGPFKSIFWLLRTYWLRWTQIVDVARSFVLGDDSGRIFFTGTDVPRVTNVLYATTGVGTYPISSLKLGVPIPIDPITFVQIFTGVTPTPGTDTTSFDGSTLSGLTIVGTVMLDAANGNPAPSIQISGNTPSCAYFDSGAGNQPYNVFNVDFNIAAGQMDIRFSCDSAGRGSGYRIISSGGTAKVRWGDFTDWNSNNHNLTDPVTGIAISQNTWYTAKIIVQAMGSTTYTVTLTVMSGASVVYTSSFNTQRIYGTFYGFWTPDPSSTVRVDNISAMAAGSATALPASGNPNMDTSVVVPEITNYVWTYVNTFGDESAPAPFSADVVISTALSRDLFIPAAPNAADQAVYGANYIADYGIIGRRLYRALGTPAVYLLVADETQLPNGINAFADTVEDSALQEPLPTEGWDLPDPNMQNILALPNGIMAGSIGNQLCLSVIGHPSAWPLDFRLPTDTNIVALGNIDTTIVVLTQGFPYIASGTDPSNYGMAKLERSYACVSKRSVSYMRGVGVIYASTCGLVTIVGAGLRLLTEEYFTEKEWTEQINPSSIIGSVKDDRYVGYFSLDGSHWRGFEFDPKAGEVSQGFTLIDESPNFDATASHPEGFFHDDLTGDLYKIEGSTLRKQFGSTLAATCRWRSKTFRSPYTIAMSAARIKPTLGYPPGTLKARLLVNDVQVQEMTVPYRTEYLTPAIAGEDFNFEIEGTWPVMQVDYAEKMEDIA